jgi:hypothetical protein
VRPVFIFSEINRVRGGHTHSLSSKEGQLRDTQMQECEIDPAAIPGDNFVESGLRQGVACASDVLSPIGPVLCERGGDAQRNPIGFQRSPFPEPKPVALLPRRAAPSRVVSTRFPLGGSKQLYRPLERGARQRQLILSYAAGPNKAYFLDRCVEHFHPGR